MGCGAVVMAATGGRVVVPLRMGDVIALFTLVVALAALPVTSRTNLCIVLRHDSSAILYGINKLYFRINKYNEQINIS
jgi:hypothetical protein